MAATIRLVEWGPTAFFKTAGTALSLGFHTSLIPQGSTVFAVLVFDNLTATTPTVSSIAAPNGTDTWARVAWMDSPVAGAGLGVRTELWRCDVNDPLGIPTSYSFPVTFSASIVAKAGATKIYTGVGVSNGYSSGATYPMIISGGGPLFMLINSTENNIAPTIANGISFSAPEPLTFGSTGGGAAANVFASWGHYTTGVGYNSNNTWNNVTDGGWIQAYFAAAPDPVLSQAAYRFYDDGTEAGSVALAAQDTAPTLDISAGDVPFQLRVRLQENGSGTSQFTDDYDVQYEKNASGVWAALRETGSLLATYDVTNETAGTGISMGATNGAGAGVQIVGNGLPISRVNFRVSYKTNVPNGTMRAEIFASDQAFGVAGSRATGPALAVSTNSFSMSSVTTTPQWFSFDFSGAPALAAGTPYYLVITTTNTVVTSALLGIDTSSPTYGGNYTYMAGGAAWSGAGTADVIFEAFVTENNVAVFPSASLNSDATSTQRLTGGTGTFVPGDITEDGVANDFGWVALGINTELVFSLKLLQADLVNGDVIRFRVQRNSAALTTYAVTPTINVYKGAIVRQASGIVPIVSASSGDATRTILNLDASGVVVLTSATTGVATKPSGVAAGTIALVSGSTGAASMRGVGAGVLSVVSALAGTVTARLRVLTASTWIRSSSREVPTKPWIEYGFSEGSGTVVYDSGVLALDMLQRSDVTPNNVMQWIPGHTGTAIYAPPGSDYSAFVDSTSGLQLSNYPNLTRVTMMSWVRLDSPAQGYGPGQNFDPFMYFWINDNSNFRFQVVIKGVQIAIPELPTFPTDGAWHHVAMSLNHETGIFRLFLDGVQVGQIDRAIGSIPGTSRLRTVVNYAGGATDDFRVFDSELTGPEVVSWMGKPVTANLQTAGTTAIVAGGTGVVTQRHKIEYVDWALAGYP